jgi:hypothetical protein
VLGACVEARVGWIFCWKDYFTGGGLTSPTFDLQQNLRAGSIHRIFDAQLNESNWPLLPYVSVSFTQTAFIFYILPEKQQSPFIYFSQICSSLTILWSFYCTMHCIVVCVWFFQTPFPFFLHPTEGEGSWCAHLGRQLEEPRYPRLVCCGTPYGHHAALSSCRPHAGQAVREDWRGLP